ncbi:unnamed protein product [Boreogadus saida]
MVRMMVDEMRQHCLNPTLSQCAFIAKGIIEKYPNSLQDRTEEGEKMGSGHYTLCQQLKSRVDNLNRNNTLARLRKERRPAVTPAATAGNSEPARKCAKTDSYGCINWQPIVLPEGETKESLLHKKEELKLIFNHEGQRGADRGRVAELMEITFETQRRNINMLPAMQELIKEWPFLFQKRFLLDHFNQLTGIELDARLRESMETKGTALEPKTTKFLVRINPEFSKCTAKFQTSKKTNKMVQRKQVSLNPHVAAFIRDFTEFDWQNF